MKDLSREEKIQQRISQLERQIFENERYFDKEQGKRIKRTFFILSGVIYLLAFYSGLDKVINISDIDIETLFSLLIVPPFAAGFIMYISFMITTYITSGALRRAEIIAKLKAELDTIKYFDTRFK